MQNVGEGPFILNFALYYAIQVRTFFLFRSVHKFYL